MADEPEETQEPDETRQLDWSSAEVAKGTLTVELSGKPSKPWKGVFERTVRLLGGGDWEDVELKAAKIRVTGVQEGVEGSLRHFLEGAVQEANAALASDESKDDGAKGDGADDEGDAKDERDDGDSRMTERFRDFGA